jgi:hypothetical protein
MIAGLEQLEDSGTSRYNSIIKERSVAKKRKANKMHRRMKKSHSTFYRA